MILSFRHRGLEALYEGRTVRRVATEHVRKLNSPWRESPLHSSGDASRLTALFVGSICPICALLTPCQAGASPLSVQRGVLAIRAVMDILAALDRSRKPVDMDLPWSACTR